MIGNTRIHDASWNPAISEAFKLIGPSLSARLAHVQWVVGVDPLFAGVHHYSTTTDGRAYGDTAHVAYALHIPGPADRRATSVILPKRASGSWGDVAVVVHELGHALHEAVGFDHDALPVSRYARTNRWEAFAEAFTSWVWGPGYADRPSPQSVAFFRNLERS